MSTRERVYWLRLVGVVPLGYPLQRPLTEFQDRRARWDWRWR